MAILSQTKQGFITFKTIAGYVKWLPRTLASLVTMNDGKSVEEKITQLNGSLAFRDAFLGNHCYTFSFGKINNGYLRSSSVFLPYAASEVNATITKINIPGGAELSKDYKYVKIMNNNMHICCDTKGANNADTLIGQVAEVNITITKK